MIFQNLYFHNVCALTEDERGGYVLHRMPLEAEEACWEGACTNSRTAVGCEIRFVPLDEEVTITLAAERESQVVLFDGSFPSGWRKKPPILKPEGVSITLGKCFFYDTIARLNKGENFAYSPDVIRILLPDTGIRFIKVEGRVRPPRPDEMPQKKLLAYGSSITNGSLALGSDSRYVIRLAESLGYDYRLLSFNGSARCELPQAQVIASEDFDFAILEMGINMIDYFTVEEFETIARKFLQTIVAAHPDKYIFCVDMYYNHNDINQNPMSPAYRAVVRKLVCEVNSDRVIYINGLSVFRDVRALTADMVHPSTYGHILLAQNLEQVIRPFLD